MFVPVILFLSLPFAEIYLLIKASHIFGWADVGLFLLLSGFVGLWCVRIQSAGFIHKLNSAFTNGQIPAERMIGALCVFVGGVLFIIPGFITDVIGLTLVLPPTRAVFVKFFKMYFARMIQKGNFRVFSKSDFEFTSTNFDGSQHYQRSKTLRDVGPSTPNLLEEPNSASFKDLNK